MTHRFRYVLIVLGFFLSSNIYAQDVPDELKVFIECDDDCYYNYLREKLPALDYVRDRLVADVHIISKSNYSNGLEQRVLFFLGRGKYAGKNDTLNYSIMDNVQLADKRDALVKNVLLGLIPYINHTSLREDIELSMKTKDDQKTQTKEDKWKLWVFRLGVYGNLQGDKNYENKSVNGWFNASRENLKVKTEMSSEIYYQNQKYNLGDTATLSFDFRNWRVSASHVKKLNEHWGLGLWGNVFNRLFSNYVYRIAFGPKFEYSIFPYKDFNTKRLVLVYDINPVFNKYYDTTIYNKTQETLFNHSLSIISQFTYPWGDLNLGVFYNNYLDDFSKNYLGLNGGINLKVTKGFNVSIWGNYEYQNNQINLRKGNVPVDQLLIRNRELFTSYNYSISLGMSYRFGSTLNNAVNPIFRGISYNINY